MDTCRAIRRAVVDDAEAHVELLRAGMEVSFEGLEPFQAWVEEQLRDIGAATERFELDRSTLAEHPAFAETLEAEPDAIQGGPNVVGRYPGTADPEVLVFAHADKTPASYRQADDGHGVRREGGRIHGPGIADDVSGVTAGLSALRTVADADRPPARSVLLGSVLGKQLGVAGTYGLMRRYGPTDGAVYLHPAESGHGLGDLKIGSNGLHEFVVSIDGRPPDTNEPHHPLYAHRGVNPIDVATEVARALRDWTDELAADHPHPGVERAAGRSAGLLLSDVRPVAATDRPVYETPQGCTLRGAIAFAPSVELAAVEAGIRETVTAVVEGTACPAAAVRIRRGDHVAEPAETPADAELVRRTADAVTAVSGADPREYYGHTASDIRYPIRYWDAPTVGIGPRAGRMGAPDEWIDREAYLETIATAVALLSDVE